MTATQPSHTTATSPTAGSAKLKVEGGRGVVCEATMDVELLCSDERVSVLLLSPASVLLMLLLP